MENKVPSCAEVNRKDITDYLSKLKFEPAEIKRNGEWWYHSPLNPPDDTPSFKVDTKRNVWYDWSIGKGGSLVDFGILYHNCSVSDFLKRFDNPLSFPRQFVAPARDKKAEAESKIKVVGVKPITSISLIQYVQKRAIDIDIALQYSHEINFTLHGKNYYAIGFKNDSGGYELRNDFFKGSSSPKNFTTIKRGSNELSVFEGFFNFYSFEMMTRNQGARGSDILCLNSLTMFERARLVMQGYDRVKFFLDRNPSGRKVTAQALAIDKVRHSDESSLYERYEDLNDMLVAFGKKNNQGRDNLRTRF